MSRVLGKTQEIINICDYIQESNIQKFERNNKKTTWDSIENTFNTLSFYLPDSAIDYLKEDKIVIKKNPLRKYTFISIPENSNEKRLIRFPSLGAKEEYKRELSFFLGLLLSSYNEDEENMYEISGEFDNFLPYILDYLYLKSDNKESDFSLKYLDKIKNYTKYYKAYNEEYNNFYDVTKEASFEFTENGYQRYIKDCQKKDEELSKFTIENMNMLSSLEAVLQLIDEILSEKELKLLILKLMLNGDKNRRYILNDYNINVNGYKYLKKELNKYKV